MRFTIALLGLFIIPTVWAHTYIDSHAHLFDFFQQSEGVEALIEAMDEGNIEKSVVMGIPVAKKWHEDEPQKPRFYAGDDAPVYWYSATDFLVHDLVSKAKPADQARLIPFLSGFNPNDKNAATQIRQLLAMHPDFWQGIGEVFARHDDITALTLGETPRINNEAMMRVYKVAAEYDLPVLLHTNITSKRERKALYEEELREVLQANKKVRFIWAHAGTSMEIHRHQEKLVFLPKLLDELLAEYKNLYIDLSWVVLEPYMLDGKGIPSKEWLALLNKYPTRFVLGSDVVGRFKSQAEIMQAFSPVLDALPATVARKISKENMLALLPRKKRQ